MQQQQQTYEIYLVVGGCDSEWSLLGKLEAESEDNALVQAAQRWKEYPQESLVALTLDSFALPLSTVTVKSSTSL